MTASTPAVTDQLALLDWRRRVAELYADVRASTDLPLAWRHWRDSRAKLFAGHQQSPVAPPERATFSGPHVFDYQPGYRTLADVEPAEHRRFELPTSGDGTMTLDRFARAGFMLSGSQLKLDLYLLEGYGGGLLVPFADLTSGAETYGAGRYLLDTIKGADLGQEDGRLVLDFNFAYQPSCSYDPRWTCPLSPPANRLSLAIRAGERLTAG